MALTAKLRREGNNYLVAVFRNGVQVCKAPAGIASNSKIVDEADLKARIAILVKKLKDEDVKPGPLDVLIDKEYTEADLGI